MMQKYYRNAAYVVVLLITLGSIFYFRKNILGIFSHTKWWLMCILCFLHIPIIAGGGLAFNVLCSRYHINLHWKEWVGLSFIANFVNQILPYRPGMGVRYLYVRHHYHLKLMDFIYIMIIYLLLSVIVSALFAFIGWSTGHLPKSFNHLCLTVIVIGTMVSCFVYWLTDQKHLMGPKNVIPFQEIRASLHLLLTTPSILMKTVLIFSAVNFLSAIMLYITFVAIHAPLPLTHCLFLVGVFTIAMIFPITPGNIGVLEVLFGTLTQVAYHNFSLGFSAIALYRASMWVPSVILGTTFSIALFGRMLPQLKEIKQIKFGRPSRVD